MQGLPEACCSSVGNGLTHFHSWHPKGCLGTLVDEHVPLNLQKIKSIIHNPETTLDVIEKYYLLWVNRDQLLVFQQTHFHSPTRYFASLMPKRGNKKYAYNVKRNFQGLYLPFEYEQHINPTVDETLTNVLFVTLTYDTKLCDFKTAWDTISADWNRYVSRLRRKYGKVLTCRVYEATENGYPHIHAIIYIPNTAFPLFKQQKGNRTIYRIPDKHLTNFKKWHSFVDVQGMVHLAEGFKYLAKYVTKSSDLCHKAVTTLALTWGFHKRAYSLGTKFKQEIFNRYLTYDLIPQSVTQTKISSQMTLDYQELRTTLPNFQRTDFEKVKMLGILNRSELKRLGGVPKHEWSHGLTEKQTEYAQYRIISLKKPLPQQHTNQEYIKNGWKYLHAIPDNQRKMTIQGLRSRRVLLHIQRQQKAQKCDMRYMHKLLTETYLAR